MPETAQEITVFDTARHRGQKTENANKVAIITRMAAQSAAIAARYPLADTSLPLAEQHDANARTLRRAERDVRNGIAARLACPTGKMQG